MDPKGIWLWVPRRTGLLKERVLGGMWFSNNHFSMDTRDSLVEWSGKLIIYA
jgi:hypothetical protein